MSEWFKTPQEMIQFYEQHKNFKELINNFVKLNPLYIALVYQDVHIFQALQNQLVEILRTELKAKEIYNQAMMESLLDFSEKLICKDLLQKEYRLKSTYPGEIVSIALNDIDLSKEDVVEIEFYRPEEYVEFCNYHLSPHNKKDFSLQNLTRFFEIGGMKMLTNRVQIIT